VLTPEEARQRCQQTRDAYRATRRYTDAYWTLEMAYNEGQQWGFISEGAHSLEVSRLKPVLDMHGSRRVRLTINEIGSQTEKASSMTNPQRVIGTVLGPDDTRDSYTRTADRVLRSVLIQTRALSHLRQANPDRHVLGTACVREVLALQGSRRTVREAQGQQPELTLGKYGVEWATVMPWEIIRDPASKSVQMEYDEETVGHEKPRSVQWVQEHYNGWSAKGGTEMGKLVHFLDEIRHLSGGAGNAPLLADSKQPGVLAEEWWLTDPAETRRIFDETGIKVRWPWMFVGYINPEYSHTAIIPVPTVGQMGLLPNPFCGLPIGGFHYHVATEAMWGTGMPWKLMQWQDFSNVAITWAAEILQLCGPKWRYQKGTVEDPSTTLNNDPWQPIPFKRVSQWDMPPERVPGVQMPQIINDVVSWAPEGMRRNVNIAPVQMGIGYRRDGSGKAYETLLREAESVPEDRITSDEITLGEMFYKTLIDTIRWATLAQLQQLTAGRVPERFLRELKRHDPRLRIARVEVHPSTMRPRTRTQTEERYVSLVSQQFLSADRGVDEARRAGVTGLNTPMEKSKARQQAEIELMMAGEEVAVRVTDKHIYHIEELNEYLDSIAGMDVDPEVEARMMRHAVAHQMALQETAGMALGQPEIAPQEGPGMPSPPAEAFAGSQTSGAAASPVNVA